MTDRAEIERLLNATGRTLEGLPEHYSIGECVDAIKRIPFKSSSEMPVEAGNVICHQSDVIEMLVDALRDALEKPMQKPLTLEALGTLGFAEVWEERRKPHRIEKTVAAYTYIAACHAKQDKEMAEVFGYNTEVRSWISIPTEGEMEAAKWKT